MSLSGALDDEEGEEPIECTGARRGLPAMRGGLRDHR
jgi:hypothetical protein